MFACCIYYDCIWHFNKVNYCKWGKFCWAKFLWYPQLVDFCSYAYAVQGQDAYILYMFMLRAKYSLEQVLMFYHLKTRRCVNTVLM